MFSLPVNSGSKPDVSSSKALTLPFTSIVPSVGYVTSVISLRIVDLPAPFFPNKATLSPFFTTNDTLLTALFSLHLIFLKINPNSLFLSSLYSLYFFVTLLKLITTSSLIFLIPFSINTYRWIRIKFWQEKFC